MATQDRVNNEGFNMLGRVLQSRMKRVSESPTIVDFGVIQGDYSLLTNQFPIPIPKTDYHVCRQLTLGEKDDILAKTQKIGQPHSGAHIHNTIDLTCPDGSVSGTVGTPTGEAPDPPDPPESSAGSDSTDGQHQHHVLIPEKMRWIKPGDHVLVVWVGTDPVVIDIILPATEVG